MSLAKSNRPAIESLDALAGRVESGTRLSVGGHHFARLPVALLREIARRGVSRLNYFAWAGGLPLELLLEAGAVDSIDICFSSLDIFGLAPKFREVAEARQFPVNDWPALSMIQGLAGGAAEPAVHAGAASGGLDHDRALPGGAFSSRRADGTGWSGSSRRRPSTPCCCMRRAPTAPEMSRSMARGRWICRWSARRGRSW